MSMQFKEKADFSFKKLPDNFIYFLCKEGEVVYVGQTTQGILRPLQHKDKEHDEVKLHFVEKEVLDLAEGYYIAKYKPKYNKAGTGLLSLMSARNKIREYTGFFDYTLNNLKKDCKLHGIEIIVLSNGNRFLKVRDFYKLLKNIIGE